MFTGTEADKRRIFAVAQAMSTGTEDPEVLRLRITDYLSVRFARKLAKYRVEVQDEVVWIVVGSSEEDVWEILVPGFRVEGVERCKPSPLEG